MTPEIPAPDERWRVEVRWLDAGGCEHVIQGTARHHDEVRGFVAVAVDELTELDAALSEPGEPSPPPPPTTTLPSGREVGTLRDLWHWSVTWSAPPNTVEHIMRSWSLTAEQLWRESSEAVDELLDLREVLRQVNRSRKPRPL